MMTKKVIATIVASMTAGAVAPKSAPISMELVSNIYDAEADMQVCKFSDGNGKTYTVNDFTAPHGSNYAVFLDEYGNINRIVVDTTIDEYQTAKTNSVYAMTCIVTEIATESDTVWITDYNGNSWGFYGIEDWQIDDVVSVVMNDNGTAEISDDTIVNLSYSAWKVNN